MVLKGLHDLQRRIRSQYQTNPDVLGDRPLNYHRRDGTIIRGVPCHVDFQRTLEPDEDTQTVVSRLVVTIDQCHLKDGPPQTMETIEFEGQMYSVLDPVQTKDHSGWMFTAVAEHRETQGTNARRQS